MAPSPEGTAGIPHGASAVPSGLAESSTRGDPSTEVLGYFHGVPKERYTDTAGRQARTAAGRTARTALAILNAPRWIELKANSVAHVLAAVIPRPNAPVELRELPEPALEPDSGLLAVELSEVCGTDVYLHQGRLVDTPYPFIPGHVTVGRLEKIRGRLIDIDGRAFREGERVTFLDVHRTCHACYYCLVAKATTRCPHRKVYGITYGLADGLTGGWARKLYIKPGTRCIALGDANAETFMAGGCGLPTALHAVERGQVSLGDTVLILGSGPVGLSALILAAMAGALRVLCIGAPDDRLATARAMGASDVLNFQSAAAADRIAWVRERTGGRGADVTIEATGAPSAVVEAMRFTRDNGRVVVVGQYTDHGETAFNPHVDLNKKHLDVRGCWGSDFSHFERGARIITDPVRGAPWSTLKLTRYGLGQANDALAAVADGKVIKALIDPAR
ncbi:MAG: zinc-binding dehydrogenase [Phycisphaerales bacterium]|nr:zinc-binding dehydrogenase [Phycisphaerales bacterium]